MAGTDPFSHLVPGKGGASSDPFSHLVPKADNPAGVKPEDAAQSAALTALRGPMGSTSQGTIDAEKSGLLTPALSAKAKAQGATGQRIISNAFSIPGDYGGAVLRDVQHGGSGESETDLGAMIMGTGKYAKMPLDERLERASREYYFTGAGNLDKTAAGGGAIGALAGAAKKYPIPTQIATFLAELKNPLNEAGMLVKGLSKVGGAGVRTAARAGDALDNAAVQSAAKRGVTVAPPAIVDTISKKLAEERTNLADVVGKKTNAFHFPERMEKAGMTGAVGNARQLQAQKGLAEAEADTHMRRIFGEDGEMNTAQQIELQHRVDGQPPNPHVPEPVKGMTIDQRAEEIRKINRQFAPQLEAMGYKVEDPETFFSRAKYRSDRPVYKDGGEDADFAGSQPTGGRGPGPLGVKKAGLTQHRTFKTLQEALDAGKELDPSYLPAEQFRLAYAARKGLIGTNDTLGRAAEIPTGLTGATQLVDQRIVPKFEDSLSKATKVVGGHLEDERPLGVRVPYEYYDEHNPEGPMIFGQGPAGEKSMQVFAHNKAVPIAQRNVLGLPEFDALGGKVPGRVVNAQYIRGLMTGLGRGAKSINTARFGRADAAAGKLTDIIDTRQEAVDAAKADNAAREQRLSEIRGSIRFAQQNAGDYDRILKPYADERLQDPAYEERGSFDDAGVYHSRLVGNARRGADKRPGAAATAGDISKAHKEIKDKLGVDVPLAEIDDAIQRLHDVGKAKFHRDLVEKTPVVRVPLGVPTDVRRAAAKVSRGTRQATERLQGVADKVKSSISDLADKRVAAVADRKLADKYYARVHKEIADVAGRIEETLTHEPRGVAKGTYLPESDLQTGLPSSSSHLLYKDYWQHIAEAKKMGAPEEDAKGFVRFIATTGALARLGIIVWPVVHGVWNLGKAYLEEGGSIGEMGKILAGKSNAAARVVPEHIATRYAAQYGAKHGMTYGELADTLGASAVGGARPIGLSRESRGAIATLPANELSPLGQVEQGVQRGITPMSGGRKITSGWDKNNDLVFNTWERNYVADLLQRKLETQGMEPGAATRSIRKAFGDYANITPAEKQAGLTKLLYFYPWMKTVLPYWGSRGMFNPASWNAPTRSIRSENEAQGDFDEQNPWTEDFFNDANGDRHVATVPDPARVTTGIMDAAMALPDMFAGKTIPTSASPNAKTKKLFGVGAARRDLEPMAEWARGHVGALPAIGLDAVFPSGKYNRLADETAPLDVQAGQIRDRVTSGLVSPIRTLGNIGGDPLFAGAATAAGFFPRVEPSPQEQARQAGIRARMAEAKRNGNKALYDKLAIELTQRPTGALRVPAPPAASSSDPFAHLVPAR